MTTKFQNKLIDLSSILFVLIPLSLISGPLIPDLSLGNDGNVLLTLETKKYPQSSSTISKGPYTISATTAKISTRARGRAGTVKIERGSKANTQWRLGSISLDMGVDGQR